MTAEPPNRYRTAMEEAEQRLASVPEERRAAHRAAIEAAYAHAADIVAGRRDPHDG